MDELKKRALKNIEQVLVQAPGLADGYAVRGLMRAFLDWDWAGGQADLERALALAPGDVVVLDRYAQLLAALGQLPRAIDVGRKGAQLDPLSADVWRDLGWFYNASGELGAAREALTRALGIAPDHVYAARELAFTELLDGKPQAALAAIGRSGADYIRNTVTALAQHDLGHEKESQQALAALDVETNAYQIAQVYAWRGDRAPAFEWLERSYLERDTGLRYLKYDPLLRKLRGDPRFNALVKKMNLPPDKGG
jgi:serine/threonine-protein kinase